MVRDRETEMTRRPNDRDRHCAAEHPSGDPVVEKVDMFFAVSGRVP
jgi:hypothetical protein